jgi:transketolase C-terminal domain/subunit
MDTTIFKADKVAVEIDYRGGMTVTIDGDPKKIVEDMALDERLHDLDVRDVIDFIGSSDVLKAMTEEDLGKWLSDSETDPTDMLNAIGEEAVLEWLNSCDSDADLPN